MPGTRAALKQLGFADSYHMVTVFENIMSHPQEWTRAIQHKYQGKGTWTDDDFHRLLSQSQSCSDIPAALFAIELAELYPDAKVVILNRDAEKWYESVLGSVMANAGPPKTPWGMLQGLYLMAFDQEFRAMGKFFKVLFSVGLGFDHAKDKDKAIAWYHERYAEFRAKIPKERCLEFKVQDGFAPLCEFLEVPVPMVKDEETGKMVQASYPRLNDRATFNKRSGAAKGLAMKRANRNLFTWIGKAAVYGGLGYFAWLQYVKRR